MTAVIRGPMAPMLAFTRAEGEGIQSTGRALHPPDDVLNLSQRDGVKTERLGGFKL